MPQVGAERMMEMSDFVWGIIIGVVILMFIMPMRSDTEKPKETRVKKKKNTSFDSFIDEYTDDPAYSYLSCNIYHIEDIDKAYYF